MVMRKSEALSRNQLRELQLFGVRTVFSSKGNKEVPIEHAIDKFGRRSIDAKYYTKWF
jgi:hypothetical protein